MYINSYNVWSLEHDRSDNDYEFTPSIHKLTTEMTQRLTTINVNIFGVK